jgi:Flp pilus assembly protein TadD
MSSNQENEFKPSTPDPRFGVSAPSSNPFVASLPVIVTKVKDTVEVSWDHESAAAPYASTESMLERLSNQAKRDTLRLPRSARAHANFGAALAKADRLDEAVLELETALSLEPNDYLAGVTLARVHVNQGHLDKAKMLYQALLLSYPKSDSILLSLAYLALRDNDYPTAEGYLHRALDRKKAAAFTNFLLGITRLKMGNVHGAISALRESARVEVRRSEFHHALGVAYVMTGDFRRAERALRTALALSPENEATVHALCNVLLTNRQFAEALEILRPHVESRPTDTRGRELLAQSYIGLGRYTQARAQLVAVMEMMGDNMSVEERARFRTNIATTFLLDGKDGSAESELVRAVELAPHWSPAPYEHLARIQARAEQWNRAKETLEHAKQLFPGKQSVRRFLAGVFAHLDRYDLAIAELQPIYAKGIAEPETCSVLGALFEWIGDYDSALRVLTEAHGKFPKTPEIINNLGYTYLMIGQVEAARTVLSSWPRSTKPHAELIATQGLLRLWEGDRAQAKLFYARAEQEAATAGDRDLAKRVRQKMYLELAKDSVRRGNLTGARLEISRGLSIRPDISSFREKLQELLNEIRKH